MGALPPNPRSLFEKSETKNFRNDYFKLFKQ